MFTLYLPHNGLPQQRLQVALNQSSLGRLHGKPLSINCQCGFRPKGKTIQDKMIPNQTTHKLGVSKQLYKHDSRFPSKKNGEGIHVSTKEECRPISATTATQCYATQCSNHNVQIAKSCNRWQNSVRAV
eukprot:6208689-Amphidinium_carterae.6